MNFKKAEFILIISLISLIFLSCATTLNVKVMRPAELDLNGAQTISVLPIKPYEYYEMREDARGVDIFVAVFFELFDRVGPEEKRCIEKLQYDLERGLIDSPYIELVSSSQVLNSIKKGTSNPADVYLTGEISDFDIFDEKSERKVKISNDDDDGKKAEYKFVKEFQRHVRLSFKYQIVDSSSGKIISFNKIALKNSSSHYDNPRDLPSAYSLLEYDLSRASKKILRELQPYTVSKSITLMKDKTKDEAFKHADDLAKKGFIKESYEEFLLLYEETEMMQAGFNAAKLQEALGNLSVAEKIMLNVYSKYQVPEVKNGLYDIQQEIKQAKRLKTQTEKNDVLDLDF